ncbi:TNT domain-containing protein [Actinomadura fibrosa]|uniref:TNT domain-containing protein n=1 Tax=Actinomadura fibrosa TaxID=111802 RepID=A0ABW2XUF9_9ACTN|nr:TNT domain-containing protein [Actinomadura fibrosa]
MRRLHALACSLPLILAALTAPASAHAAPRGPAEPHELCTGAYHDDARLGPSVLPRPSQPPVGPLVENHRPTGELSDDAFLKKYWKPETPEHKATWNYPPSDGFIVHDGQPVKHKHTVQPNEHLDRFGAETGRYLAPAGAPYAKRSLPPNGLTTVDHGHPCGYHLYHVQQAFTVWEGTAAPWFEQPGGGEQIQLDSALLDPGQGNRLNVAWLVAHHYLTDITPVAE